MAGGSGTGTPATPATAVLFSVAEARAFDKAQLASATDFPAVDILAKEAEIREWLERACGVNFSPTTHADEYHDGDNTADLLPDWPLVTSVTAASIRTDDSWTALTAGELGDVFVTRTGLLHREGSYWPLGSYNVKVTYVAGHAAVPALIKRAALMVCVNEMPAQNAPWASDGFDAGGTSFTIARGDGYRDQWSALPDVMKAIRMYSRALPGIT